MYVSSEGVFVLFFSFVYDSHGGFSLAPTFVFRTALLLRCFFVLFASGYQGLFSVSMFCLSFFFPGRERWSLRLVRDSMLPYYVDMYTDGYVTVVGAKWVSKEGRIQL